MAGFKYKKFSFTGGSAEFPSGISAADIQTKERAIVKGFADALIAMNIGWGCDTTRNATTSDFVDVPKYSSSTAAPGLFLVNATSGCKLFIAYLGYSGDNPTSNSMALYDTDGTTKILPPDQYTAGLYNTGYPTAQMCVTGFVMSMIPAGSTNSFGSTFKASEFLPADATRLCGSTQVRNGLDGVTSSIYNFNAGTNLTYAAFATTYCVGYGLLYNDAVKIYYFCGKLLADLANPAVDITNQARYGTIFLSSAWKYNSMRNERNPNELTSVINVPQVTISAGNFYVWGLPGDSIPAVNATRCEYNGNQVCDSGGNWITQTNTRGVIPLMEWTRTLSPATFDMTSNNRPWTPICVFVVSTDPQNDGVYNGNCFKGYLDTDLFRCSPQFAAGTVLDNGNFVCTGTGCLTLGWDPTNESW